MSCVQHHRRQCEHCQFGGVIKSITSTHTTDNTTFSDESSVIRVGDGTSKTEFTETGRTPVSLTIGERVQVTTAWCYGISVFGSKTQETLIVNGNVAVTGNFSAISGNGSAWFKGTTITINPTATITAKTTNAIYQPQDGVLNVYGTVGNTSNKGGIEAKAGTVNIYDGAKVNGYKTTKHTANNNGCSTTGYAIAVVNNSAYAGGVKVNIDNLTGEFNYKLAIIDDDEVAADKKGSITITNGYFKNSYTPDASFIALGKKLFKGMASCTVTDAATPIVASIDKYDYVSIDKATSDWSNKSTLTLKADVEAVPQSVNGKTKTLDLNGHTWKGIYSEKQNGITCAFQIFTSSTSKLTINDSKGGGCIIGDDKITEAIWLGNAAAWKDTNTATLIVNGGKLQGKYYAIAGNGAWKGKTNITINGGELVGQYAIYHPQKNGTLKITGGTLTGSCSAVEIRAGQQVDITGGTFVSTATSKNITANGSGTTVEGYALAISQHTTQLPINVNITGGTFKGINAFGVVNPQGNATDNINIAVTGGTFEATAADGEALYMGHKNGTLKVSDGKFKGKVLKDDGANLNLLGGSYTIKPDESLFVNGFVANTVEGSEYPYQVDYKKVAATVGEDVTLTDDRGAAISGDEKDAALNAVKETVADNAAVSNSTLNIGEAISDKAGSDGKTLKQLVDAAAGTNKANITAVKTSVSMKLKSASVKDNTDGTKLITKMVYDIKPVAVAFAGDQIVATVDVPNELITQKIKFRLPVAKNATNKYVGISHKADGASTADDLGLFAVQTENADKYIEMKRDNFSEYTMTLSDAQTVMTVYKANSQPISMSQDKDTWHAVQNEYPNAIAIGESEFANEEGITNVLVETVTGGGRKVYDCPNFVLTDLAEFYSPYDFYAAKGSYTRTANNFTGKDKCFNSVCVPFELEASDLSSTAEIFLYSSLDEAAGTIGFVLAQDQKIPAGTPCIIYENARTEWNVSFTDREVAATPNNVGNMKGTFVKTSDYKYDEASGVKEYFSVNAEDKFQYLSGELYPFRSCLYIHTDSGIDVQKAYAIALDRGTTGVDGIEAVPTENADIYTIGGMKVGTSFDKLPKGIYIQNGKKIVKK